MFELAIIARAYHDTGDVPDCKGGCDACPFSDGEYDPVFDVQWEACKHDYRSPIIDHYAKKYAYESKMGSSVKYEDQDALYVKFIRVYDMAVSKIQEAKRG